MALSIEFARKGSFISDSDGVEREGETAHVEVVLQCHSSLEGLFAVVHLIREFYQITGSFNRDYLVFREGLVEYQEK